MSMCVLQPVFPGLFLLYLALGMHAVELQLQPVVL